MFASLDMNEGDHELFYVHLGHGENMNKDIYQAPLAIDEITKAGKRLLDIDAGNGHTQGVVILVWLAERKSQLVYLKSR